MNPPNEDVANDAGNAATKEQSPSPSLQRARPKRSHQRPCYKSLIRLSIPILVLLLRQIIVLIVQQKMPFIDETTMMLRPASATRNAISDATNQTMTLPASVEATNKNKECVSAAIILFGVPKSFKYIWDAYLTNIANRNPHLNFTVHMHMYDDLHQKPFSNSRTKERNVTLETPEYVRAILNNTIPSNCVTSSQSTFDNAELTWVKNEMTRTLSSSFNIHTVKNVFRQGNSMKEAYQSATSTRGEKQHHDGYGIYVFARSDTLLLSPIDIPCAGLGDREIQLPTWQPWGGYNDRFALAGPAAADIYIKAKTIGFKKMFMDRPQNGVDDVNNMNTNMKWDNTETMLKVWLDNANEGVEIISSLTNWAQLLRVRSGGLIHLTDSKQHRVRPDLEPGWWKLWSEQRKILVTDINY